jgi:hypothetical protein
MHEWLLPVARADCGPQRRRARLPADQHHNVEPDEVSKKSLRLDKKLQWLAEQAEFDVNINSVLGGGVRNPEDARTINRRARELGFSTSIGIIHDGSGRLKPLNATERAVFDNVSRQINAPKQVLKNLYSGIRTFEETWRTANPTSGGAGPARVTSASTNMAWCTIVLSSAATPPSRWGPIPCTTSGEPSTRRKPAPHSAR